MPRLTEYELEREENIRKNRELLRSLGIFQSQIDPKQNKPPATHRTSDSKKSGTKKRARSPDNTPEPNKRRSARLSVPDPLPSSDPIDFLSLSPKRAPVKVIRQLTPTSTPELDENEWAEGFQAPLPIRDAFGTLHFAAETHFTPNLTPEEMLRAGSFGGTAFRRHYSKIVKRVLPEDDYTEFPASWYAGLDVEQYLTSAEYRPVINKYRVKAGQSLDAWETSGWIHEQDPRGWFQWYCRFYLGRRTADDGRQIKRWLGVCGLSGRFKRSLVKKIAESGASWNDASVSPVIRQTLQHWAYRLTEEDYEEYM